MEALGKLDEGLQFKQQALVRNPRSPWLLVQIATSYWHQRKHDETLVWAQRALDLDPTHLIATRLLSCVHSRRGDLVRFLEENFSGAPPAGMSDEALTTVRDIVAEMRCVQASEGIGGVTRYMADAVDDPRVLAPPQHAMVACPGARRVSHRGRAHQTCIRGALV